MEGSMAERTGVLIVDDDEGASRTLQLILEKNGYGIETAGTGREAVEKAQRRSNDLALLKPVGIEPIGAAAVMGTTTLPKASGEAALAPILQNHLVTPGKSMGLAIRDAKHELEESRPGLLEMTLGTSLLGDPGLEISQ
jgi:DNA-binding NarL/FixJ family response regulator